MKCSTVGRRKLSWTGSSGKSGGEGSREAWSMFASSSLSASEER